MSFQKSLHLCSEKLNPKIYLKGVIINGKGFWEHAPVVQLEERSNAPHESEDEEFAEVVGFQDAFLFLAWYETVEKVARLSQKHAQTSSIKRCHACTN